MVSRSQILAVLLCLSFQAFGNPISPQDLQACTDLCNKCNGKTIIKDDKCECSIAGDDKKGADCMKRMAKEVEQPEVILGIPETDAEEEGEGRSVRCLLGSRHRYEPEEVQRIAQYFMGGGPLTGSPLKQPCEPSEKMVGASESDLEELPSAESEEEPEDPTVGDAQENPWCPCSVFGDSQSAPLQPENTYPKSNRILGSAKSKRVLGSTRKLQQPLRFSDASEGMLGASQRQQPLRFSVNAMGNLGTLEQLQLPQSFSDKPSMLGDAQQPFPEPRGFSGSLQLQLPQGFSDDARRILGSPRLQQPLGASADPNGILGNLQLQIPRLSDDSRGMLGAPRAQGFSSDPRRIFGNLQFQLPQIPADSRGLLGAPQSPGLSSNAREFLSNLQLQLPQGFSGDSRFLGEPQQIQQPQYSSVPLSQMLNPQPFYDIAEAIGRIQVPVPQPRNLVGDSLSKSSSSNAGSNLLGATQPKVDTPLVGSPKDAEDPEIIVPKKASKIVGARNCNSDCSPSGPKVGATKNTDCDIVGAPKKKANVADTPETSDIVGASNCRRDCEQSDPKVGATKNTDCDIVGAAKKKAKVADTPKTSDIVGASNCRRNYGQSEPQVGATKKTDCDIVGAAKKKAKADTPKPSDIVGASNCRSNYGQSDPQVGATKNTDCNIVGAAKKKAKVADTPKTANIVGASNCRRDCEQSEPKVRTNKSKNSETVGDSLPVQPGYSNQKKTSDSALDTPSPQIKLYTLNELIEALTQRSMTGISNIVGRFQIPGYQVSEPRQQTLGAARSNSNSNDLETLDEADPATDDAKLQAGAPQRPTTGTSEFSWIPQTVDSVIGIFQPLVEQGVQLALASMAEQQRGVESQQVGMGRSQFGVNYPQVGLFTPRTNLGAPRMATFNSPLGLSAQYLPNSDGYLINSQFSLPFLPRSNSQRVRATRLNQRSNYPNSEESPDDASIVGALRKSGAKKIDQRPGASTELTRQFFRKRFGKSKFPREATENSEEISDEVLSSEASTEVTEKIIEEAVKKEIRTLETSKEKILEQKLEKTLEKTLEKRENRPGVKVIVPEEKSVEVPTEKTTMNVKITKPQVPKI